MDDFAALQKLKGLSVSKKASDKKDGSSPRERKGAASYAMAGAGAKATDTNRGVDSKAEPYNYYDNSYQRYMAEYGITEMDADNDNDGGEYGDDDDDDGSGTSAGLSPSVRKDPSLGLDLSALKANGVGSHMSPQHAAFNVLDHDPFAKFREQESDSPPAPLKPIGSVGQIKKAYREREKAEEKEQQRRHAKHVVKIAQNVSNATTAVYNDPYGNINANGNKLPKTRKRTGTGSSGQGSRGGSALEFGGSTVSALSFDGYGTEGVGEGFPMLGGALDKSVDSVGSYSSHDHDHDQGGGMEDCVLIDKLDYTEFSCDSTSRNDLLERVKRILQSGSQVVLQAVHGGDLLDCKMLLKTLSSHMAMYTENGFMPAEIRPNVEGCLQMQLCPKGMKL